MSSKIKIGILGAGVVGSGVIYALKDHPTIEIKKVLVRNLDKARGNNLVIPKELLTTNSDEILNDSEINIIVEVLGGLSPARELVTKAIKNKKHIVTANKDLIATYGAELFELAKENNVQIQFEASVCGAIPVINTIKQTLSANEFTKITGILNGTTNFILSEMLTKTLSYETCLKDAQKLGYAEPDPTNDVSGKDVAYKLAILASIAFGVRIKIEEVFHEGIQKITPTDIKMAEELGYRLKLIGIAKKEKNGEIDVRVHPAFIKQDSTLASVFGSNNGIKIESNLAGELTLIGPGAGSLPTASSVIGDINLLVAQLESNQKTNPLFVCKHTEFGKTKSISETENSYFLRIKTSDTAGVVGQIGTIFGNNKVSIKALTQKGLNPDHTATITILTHVVVEKDLQAAVKEIENLKTIKQIENVIRVLE